MADNALSYTGEQWDLLQLGQHTASSWLALWLQKGGIFIKFNSV
jgi:hypothetical protein